MLLQLCEVNYSSVNELTSIVVPLYHYPFTLIPCSSYIVRTFLEHKNTSIGSYEAFHVCLNRFCPLVIVSLCAAQQGVKLNIAVRNLLGQDILCLCLNIFVLWPLHCIMSCVTCLMVHSFLQKCWHCIVVWFSPLDQLVAMDWQSP